jgi:hypothetical protein
MPIIKFYDPASRSTHSTDKYQIEMDKRGRARAVATGPKGNKLYQYVKSK